MTEIIRAIVIDDGDYYLHYPYHVGWPKPSALHTLLKPIKTASTSHFTLHSSQSTPQSSTTNKETD